MNVADIVKPHIDYRFVRGQKVTGALQEAGVRHNTSKATGHSYMPIYEEYFASLRGEAINLLEIGVYEADSIRLWLEWFPFGHITGIDTALECSFKHERFKYISCDQKDARMGKLFPDNWFDVIIDDADHRPEYQRASQHYLWDALKPGGLYFVEDVNVHPQFYSIHGQDILKPWSMLPGFQIWANFLDQLGNYRDDDILILVRK